MFRLIESIRLEDGVFHRLHYHQQRMDRSVLELSGVKNQVDLFKHLNKLEHPSEGIFKCRVIYTEKIESVEFIQYQIKEVKSLKLVYSNDIEYSHKFEDRSKLESLFTNRGTCDEILIVKNNLITDSSFGNVIFFDGNRWITPDQPLLHGTMRQFVLDAGEIKEERITVMDLSTFKTCKLINALIGFNGPEIDVNQIVP